MCFGIDTSWERKKLPSHAHKTVYWYLLCTSQFQNCPTPPLPGQSPAIWCSLSSVQRGIWSKMRPARWGIWLSCQNVCQRSEAKGFCNSLIQHVSRVHGSWVIALVDSTWVFLLLSFYIVILWNMPLFKVWSEDKLNKKIICSGWKFCRTCFHSCFSIPGGWGIWPSLKL